MLQDLRHALRLLIRARGWTAVIVVSLALGIGVNTALFSVVDALLFRVVPARDPGSLVRLRWTGQNDVLNEHSEYAPPAPGGREENAAFSFAMFRQLAGSNHTLSEIVACAPFELVNVVAGGEANVARGFIASGNYFRVLGVAASAGRLFDTDDDSPAAPAVAVISHQYWQKRFGGDRAVVGRSIRVNDVPVIVVGVVAPEFTGIQRPGARQIPDITLPLALEARLRGEARPLQASDSSTGLLAFDRSNSADATNWWLEIVGRLKPGVAPAQVEANLDPVFARTARSNIEEHLASLSAGERAQSDRSPGNVPTLHVESAARGVYDADVRDVTFALMLSGAVGLVLIVVCANVANLLLSRAVARRHEMAIRLSLGASRARVVRQMLTESLLLASIGGGVGLLATSWLQRAMPSVLGESSSIDWHLMAFACGVTALTGLLFGLAPALTAVRRGVGASLQESGRAIAGSGGALGRALLVFQVALSVMLLVAAAMFIRTTWNLRRVDVGFDTQNLLLFTVSPSLNHYEPARERSLYEQLLARLPGVPGVRAASLSQPALLTGAEHMGSIYMQGRSYERGRESGDRMYEVIASPTFFETMGLPIVRGRALTSRDTDGAPPVALINEAAARAYFAGRDPIGARIGWTLESAGRLEVVGIVRDAKYDSLRDPAPPTMYEPYLQKRASVVTFEVRTASAPSSYAAAARDIGRQIDPNLPLLNVVTQAEAVEDRFQRERAFARAYTAFGALALVVASVGLFGLVSYAVARRRTEMAIRMALGARPLDVQVHVLRSSMRLVLPGIAIGVAGAVAAGPLVRAFLFGVPSTDPYSVGAAVGMMLAICIAASYLPARQASRIDPLAALRCE